MSVLSKIRWRRKKECRKKLPFAAWEQASAQAYFDTVYYGTKHFVYRCSVCSKWHLTHAMGAGTIDPHPDLEGRVLNRHFTPDEVLRDRIVLARAHRRIVRRRNPRWLDLVLCWFHQEMGRLGDERHRAIGEAYASVVSC